MSSLLKVATTWSGYINKYFPTDNQSQKNLLTDTFTIISTVLWVVLGLVAAIGAVYAIYLGVKLARADEQGKRDDAKKHLITVCIAVGVTIVLIVFFNTLLPMIISAFGKEITGSDDFTDPSTDPSKPNFLLPMF